MRRTDNNEMDFTSGSLYKKIAMFTLPIMLSNVVQLLFNATDMIVVGRFSGSNSLAAVGSTTSLIALIISLFNGVSVGVNVVVAQHYGAKNDDDIEKSVHTAMIMAVISGIFLIFAGIFLSRRLLILMQSPQEVIGLSELYLKIYFLGMPGYMVYTFGSAILRAVGDSKRPLYYLIICGIINVIANLIFVIIFNMDVAGVSIATVMSQYISAVMVVVKLMHENGSYRLDLKKLTFDTVNGIKILKVGIPVGLQSIAMPFSNVIIQTSINSFGAVVVAGNAAAVSLENMIYAALKSVNQALICVEGQNFGARQPKRVTSSIHICMLYAAALGVILGIAVNVSGSFLLSIYTTEPEAIVIGMLRLRYVCLPYFLCGALEVSSAMLCGIGVTVPAMIMSIIGVSGMRILWVFTAFQIFPSLICLYLSYPISWAITFVAQYVSFRVIWRRYKINPFSSK